MGLCWVYVYLSVGTQVYQLGVLELQVVASHLWVLKTELCSSASTVYTPNSWSISPVS